ncbi:MAG: DUF370 domain-containing protein [Oscillospiraceae bacterium]|nr:DUF370 domain-containing protein [Oscillospiraceae bacterium]
MYLHLGQDVVVREKDIIGIFDIDTASVSKITKEYFTACERSGQVVNVTDDLPKTFVVCRDKKNEPTVYISQISSATLKKRQGRNLF